MIVAFEDANGEIVYGNEYSNNTTLEEIISEAKSINFDKTRPIKFVSICINQY